jgi:hypothetical protein
MSELTKQALKVENNMSFPNNNAGLITPSALRTFNEDMIDSTVNQAVYTADSASFNSRINAITGSGGSVNTGSLLTTASFNNSTRNLTFTKGDSSQFSVNIPDVSGSTLPSGVVSGSSQINYPQISNIPAGIVSGSSQLTSSYDLRYALSGSGGGTGNGFPFSGSAVITGSLSVSETIKSQVYINPQTLDGFVIPTNNNAMLVGPVAISGSVVVEGNSNLLILSQITSSGATPLPSGVVSGSSQLTSSYDLRYTLSGSVQPLPSGVVSGSSQLTSSYDLRYALSGSGGGTIPTGSFATTGSNTFIGNQTITGSLYLSSSNEIVFNVPNFPGQPAPGGLSVTGSMAVNGNFAVNGGGFTVGQVNTPKIVGQGGTLQIVSDVLVFNDSGFGAPKNLGVSGSAFVSQSLQVGGDLFVGGNKQFNVGAFTSNISQSGSANVSQSVNFEITDKSEGVSIVSGSRITIANSGTYNIQFSAQIDRVSGSGTDEVYFWLKKNGTNVANSAGVETISGAALAAKTLAAWNYVVDTVANDYYELVWESTDTNIHLTAITATGNIPAIPSVILTVTQAR